MPCPEVQSHSFGTPGSPRGEGHRSSRGLGDTGVWRLNVGHSGSILAGLAYLPSFSHSHPSKRLIILTTLVEARKKGKERGYRMGRKNQLSPLLALTFPGCGTQRLCPRCFLPHLYTSVEEAPWLLETRSFYSDHGREPTCHTGPQMA